jgi:hypothetical protein
MKSMIINIPDGTFLIGYLTAANRKFVAIDCSGHNLSKPFSVYEVEPDGSRAKGRAYYERRSEALDDLHDRARRWLDDGDAEPPCPEDNLSDVEADAMTLASAGMGTDEDYGRFSDDEF